MSRNKEATTHIVIDIKTGHSYGLMLDAAGKCLGVQPLVTSIESVQGYTLAKFGPESADDDQADPAEPPAALPFGQTIIAVEAAQSRKKAQVFTIAFPKQEDMEKGQLPAVAKKALTDDLIRSGVAAAIKGLEEKKTNVLDEENLNKALQNIQDMIGLDTAKLEIRQNIAIARFNRMKEEMGLSTKPISRHMVFIGSTGTGKTTFAREVAKVYHALGFIKNPTVHEVNREDLVVGFVGQTAPKTREQIEKAKGGILFIDEAYALSCDASGDSKDFGREAINTLVAAMENMREDLIVIVAGYPEPMKRFIDSNEGLKSRFMTYIQFDDYTMPQLIEIMDFMLEDRGYQITDDARDCAFELLGEEKDRAKEGFGNGRIVRNLVEKAEKEIAMRLDAADKLKKQNGMTEQEFKTALTTITLDDMKKVTLKGIEDEDSGFKGFGFGFAAAKNDNGPRRNPEPVGQHGKKPASIR